MMEREIDISWTGVCGCVLKRDCIQESLSVTPCDAHVDFWRSWGCE